MHRPSPVGPASLEGAQVLTRAQPLASVGPQTGEKAHLVSQSYRQYRPAALRRRTPRPGRSDRQQALRLLAELGDVRGRVDDPKRRLRELTEEGQVRGAG